MDKSSLYPSSPPSTQGRQILAKMKWSDVPRDDRVAAHEAGHALLAWYSMHVTSVDYTDIRPGKSKTAYSLRMIEKSSQMNWDRLVILMGGLAGEAIAFGTIRSGTCHNDLIEARDTAAHIAENFGTLFPWKDDPSSSKLDISRMFTDGITPFMAEILNIAFRKAKQKLTCNRAPFDRLREELAGTRRLAGRDFTRILGPRIWSF